MKPLISLFRTQLMIQQAYLEEDLVSMHSCYTILSLGVLIGICIVGYAFYRIAMQG